MKYETARLSGCGYAIEVNFFGAELISIQKNGEPNVLWTKNEIFWNRVSPVLFPIVGRLKENTFRYNDENYSMSQHGFARDLDFDLMEQTDKRLLFQITSTEETKQSYPFEFEFKIEYALHEYGLEVTFWTKNTGNNDMCFSVGGHPAFELEFPIDSYQIIFNNTTHLKRHLLENGLFTGENVSLDVSDGLVLNYPLFAADALVFKDSKFSTVSLVHQTKGPILSLHSNNWKAFGIWTKNEAPFICLEPWWGWADDVHSTSDLKTKAGIQTLKSQEQITNSYRIEIH